MNVMDELSRRLTRELPAGEAHREMLPDIPSMNIRLAPPPATARASAVLVPLILTKNGLPDLLLTVRSSALQSHGGQLAFPGGRLDAGEGVVDCALRELYEETGVPSKDVTVLGELTPIFIPPSNSAVTPIVAVLAAQKAYNPSEAEVKEIFTVPLSWLLDPASLQFHQQESFGKMVQWPAWKVHPSVLLWGATAMITNELLWIIKDILHAHQDATP